MSQSLRPTLAALIGAAALTASPAAALQPEAAQERSENRLSDERGRSGPLGALIEARLRSAQEAHRYEDIDALATLWMTLERRGQLDRQVERGDQFINVSLRNQRRSELRSEARRHRYAGSLPVAELAGPIVQQDQALDAERFISGLEEPYRSAVLWSLTGRNHREVAEEMGASHAAVRKWAQRLRDSLSDEQG